MATQTEEAPKALWQRAFKNVVQERRSRTSTDAPPRRRRSLDLFSKTQQIVQNPLQQQRSHERVSPHPVATGQPSSSTTE